MVSYVCDTDASSFKRSSNPERIFSVNFEDCLSVIRTFKLIHRLGPTMSLGAVHRSMGSDPLEARCIQFSSSPHPVHKERDRSHTG